MTSILENNKVSFTNTELPDIIELKRISQSYDGGKKWVIKDLDLLIEHPPTEGRFVVILGASGCGKSTLLRYISGLQKPTSGEVLIKEKPLAHSIPMVFQQYSSIPWLTVLENVMLSFRFKGLNGKEQHDKALDMIKKVGLAGHEKKYAQDKVLSGGQMQRISLCRCLLTDSDIILFDEPCSALDLFTGLELQLLIKKIEVDYNRTMVYITHNCSEAVLLADKIYIMQANPGKIVKEYTINLPAERTFEIRKSQEFLSYVSEIEETMFSLFNKQKSRD